MANDPHKHVAQKQKKNDSNSIPLWRGYKGGSETEIPKNGEIWPKLKLEPLNQQRVKGSTIPYWAGSLLQLSYPKPEFSFFSPSFSFSFHLSRSILQSFFFLTQKKKKKNDWKTWKSKGKKRKETPRNFPPPHHSLFRSPEVRAHFNIFIFVTKIWNIV